jgi:hypothetical protein
MKKISFTNYIYPLINLHKKSKELKKNQSTGFLLAIYHLHNQTTKLIKKLSFTNYIWPLITLLKKSRNLKKIKVQLFY